MPFANYGIEYGTRTPVGLHSGFRSFSRHPTSLRDDRMQLLTVNETAEFLRVSRRQVYVLLSRGDLCAVTVGERLRFRDTDLERYLSRSTPVPSTDDPGGDRL